MKAMRPRDIATCVGHFMKNGDLDGILTMFHPDCVLAFPQGADPVHGIESIREAFATFTEIRPTLHSDITGELINGDIALLSATWSVEGPDGAELASGHSTEVTKRNPDGSWVYFIDCPHGPPLKPDS